MFVTLIRRFDGVTLKRFLCLEIPPVEGHYLTIRDHDIEIDVVKEQVDPMARWRPGLRQSAITVILMPEHPDLEKQAREDGWEE